MFSLQEYRIDRDVKDLGGLMHALLDRLWFSHGANEETWRKGKHHSPSPSLSYIKRLATASRKTRRGKAAKLKGMAYKEREGLLKLGDLLFSK